MTSHFKSLRPQQSRRRAVTTCGAFWIGVWFLGGLVLPPLLSAAQEERSLTAPTAWWWYHEVSAEFITEIINEKGARIVDIEIEQVSPYRFSVVLVKNEGLFRKSWRWYHGIRGVGGIASKVKDHPDARIIDLEVVEVDYGDGKGPQYTVVLVDNQGSGSKRWWREYNGSLEDVGAKLDTNGARLTDIDVARFAAYEGAPRFCAVMVDNRTAAAKSWWWYVNVSPELMASKLRDHNARIIDLERSADGRFAVIMQSAQGEPWWYYLARSPSQVAELIQRHQARIIDLETHWAGGKKYFDVVLLGSKSVTRLKPVFHR